MNRKRRWFLWKL